MTSRASDGRRIDGHETWADQNQADRAEQADGKTGDSAHGVESSPKDREHDDGQVGGSGDGKSQSHEEGDVRGRSEHDGYGHGNSADDEGGDPSHADFLAGFAFHAPVNDVGPEVVSERSGSADGKAGDHGKNGGESNRTNEGEEDVASQSLREERRAHVGPAVSSNK